MKYSVEQYGLRGYASIFGVQDSEGTIVDRGAFARAVAQQNAGKPFALCYTHNVIKDFLGQSLIIGAVQELRETDLGLYFRATLIDTLAAHDVLQAVASGAMPGVSFSFDLTTPDGYEDQNGILHFTRLDLLELGPTLFPSNEFAFCELYPLENASGQPVAQSAA